MIHYGCYDRSKLRHTAVVQSGWGSHQGMRFARMITIADPMSKDCEYQKKQKNDPKCLGCKHMEES